ncbi:MAG: hypothetical protein SGJ00_12200 [bacterium]|nr:hypothetical protein [bacterium]
MKKLILSSALVALFAFSSYACEGGKCEKGDKNCAKKECAKDKKCDKKGGPGECKFEKKGNKDGANCNKPCKAETNNNQVKPTVIIK